MYTPLKIIIVLTLITLIVGCQHYFDFPVLVIWVLMIVCIVILLSNSRSKV